MVAQHLAFMLPVLAGFIASSIGDRPGLVAGFAAGALANAGGAGFLGANRWFLSWLCSGSFT